MAFVILIKILFMVPILPFDYTKYNKRPNKIFQLKCEILRSNLFSKQRESTFSMISSLFTDIVKISLIKEIIWHFCISLTIFTIVLLEYYSVSKKGLSIFDKYKSANKMLRILPIYSSLNSSNYSYEA